MSCSGVRPHNRLHLGLGGLPERASRLCPDGSRHSPNRYRNRRAMLPALGYLDLGAPRNCPIENVLKLGC